MKDKAWIGVIPPAVWMLPVLAEAEGTGGGRDLTPLVLTFGAAVLALGVWVWKQHILPFLERHELEREAQIAVECAEAVFGRGHGKEKWDAALEKMAQRGWNIDCGAVRDCLEAAWEMLNLAQIAAGIKESAGNPQKGADPSAEA